MTQTLILNITIIAVLVTLFASIYHLRSSPRLRLWIVGWLFVLAHFGALLWQPTLLPLANMATAVAVSALMLCGISFLLSASVLATSTRRLQVALGLSIPSLTFVWLASFHIAAPVIYVVLELLGHGLALVLLWYFYRGRLVVTVPGTAVVTICSHWILYEIIRGRPEVGVLLILMEFFSMHALLFWEDHEQGSAGVVTTTLGLLCWAAVFPLSLAMDAHWPGVQINPELWNVPKYFVAFGMIVTLLEEEVRLSSRQRAQYQMLFEDNPLPMWIFARSGLNVLEVNAAALGDYGYTRDEFLAMTMEELLTGMDTASQASRNWSADNGRRTDGPWRLKKRDGTEKLVETSVQSVHFEGREARLLLAQDVTERIRLHEQLIHQANHDPLTGLPNRLLLQDRMQVALAAAARHGSKAGILCMDVDRFKQINDTFGHDTGDSCLKEIASRLRQRLRTVDTAARTGGEEFMVILDEMKSRADAARVAEDLLFALSAPHVVDGRRIQLSASIGIAIYPDDAREAADLWRMSDVAMYKAKQAGGNRHQFFSSVGEEEVGGARSA
ncbi:MAG TPA: sensor domain-containing diguanylate cyclase [Acidobacteriaceae bacterium]